MPKKKIKIILLEDIKNRGQAGDIVTVSDGYARNFLFPQGKAALATPDSEDRALRSQQASAQTAEQDLAKLQTQAKKLDGTELTLTAKVKEGSEIYGSITPLVIAKELNKQAGTSLKAKDIALDQPVTTLGSTDVVVHLSPEVEINLRLTIEPDTEAQEKTDDSE